MRTKEGYVMRRLAILPVLGLLLTTLVGCGSDEEAPAETTTTKSIAVSIEGGKVTPSGDRVDVAVGQPVELVVTADEAGQIHMHSDPEQEFDYSPGTTTLQLGSFDVPGIIEVESHALGVTIVQLQVK
ncbi:hypothetical protein [Nocardioides sp.]|uniref:hypothetical protein n=1 Tax=Nocardioides sp. TaxID=35761 RepID=UPI0039E347DC